MLLSDIAARCGGEVHGDSGIHIDGVASLHGAGKRHITFYDSSTDHQNLAQTGAGAVILACRHVKRTALPCLIADNPKLLFIRVAEMLQVPPQFALAGIAASAHICEGAELGGNVAVGEFAYIGQNAVIGDDCRIHAGAVVGDGVTIGAATVLYPRVVIYPNVRIGRRCLLHAGVVIGADGFGYAADRGEAVKFPHFGGVRIGDGVEIGANSAIDRGALNDTVIGAGVKIDNLVQIGHNVRIGDNSQICGNVGIAGSAEIGSRCLVGGGAGIAGHLKIGDDVRVAGHSAVTHNIPAGETVAAVFPARPVSEWRRFVGGLRRLIKSAK